MLKKSSLVISIFYTVLLTALSLFKINLEAEHLPLNSDKVYHAIAYSLFTLLWFAAFHFKLKMQFNKALLITGLFSFSYGILIEVLQGWLTISRQGDVKDVIANTIGMVFAVLLIWGIKKRVLKNNNTLLF
ncbi:VanZ family protein [Lacinutrix sp. Hel_I_90]|uniref:VanZ family protein n=1 Tax=Lacinutrix sp. Hel_I_90 TaxID=1249999 RepID=UPI0018CEA10A|nr:VanZ family protein [Lacinutrix sp. Hel_I_90]